jgi:eukaryotic-like serine/threonine-protein kinase
MAKVPESIGKYKIVGLIAQGGMGAVYKGNHPTLKRPVILKKLTLRGNPDFVERFRREARLLMDFRNDNIVDVYDHFKEGRSHYIVLEYIDGLSLEQLIRRERYLPNEMALYILYEACKALKYAHNKEVVHRDIKPANILLSKRGEVKLVDFGIATSSEDAESGLTREGMTLGSPSYMAPEQFESSRSVDKRADIYSIGVMLYESVTGKKPFPGGFSAELVAAIQKGKYPPPATYNPKVSRLVRRIIRRCVHPKRKRRYQDLESLLKILRNFFKGKSIEVYRRQLQRAVEGKTVQPLESDGRSRLKKLPAAALGGLLLFSAAAAVLYSLGYYHEWLKKEEVGALNLRVIIDDAYKSPEDYYIRAWMFTDTVDNAVELEMDALYFSPLASKEGEGLEFSSRRLYLPEDEYRIKLQIENALYWKSFYLETRDTQKQNINTREGRVLEFHYGGGEPLPLEVHFFVQDRDSWENITEEVLIEVEGVDGRRRAWSAELAEELETGTVYRFHFSAPGYEAKTFSLLIRPEQNVLRLNPRLVPTE